MTQDSRKAGSSVVNRCCSRMEVEREGREEEDHHFIGKKESQARAPLFSGDLGMDDVISSAKGCLEALTR
jgi:hypothetical protein